MYYLMHPILCSEAQLHRPIHEQARIVPSALREYRQNYQFLGPCCLCPLLKQFSEGLDFVEAAIYAPLSGAYAEEYIAECARSRCGYLGLWSIPPQFCAFPYFAPIVPLERLFNKPGVPLKSFSLRGILKTDVSVHGSQSLQIPVHCALHRSSTIRRWEEEDRWNVPMHKQVNRVF